MKSGFALWVGALSSLFVFTQANAALNLELTQGIDAAIPIAVVPFANEQANAPGETSVSAIIKSDLQNSGQFRASSPGLLSQKPTTVADVSASYWRRQKVDDVLIGQVKAQGGQQYQVSYQLVGVINSAKSTSPTTTLLNESFRVNQAGLRELAHHISDQVYQKLTGVRGVFSTKLAYVLVQRRLGRPSKYALEVADEDGFNPVALLTSNQPIMSPTWTPNGRDIAYVSFENHRARIFMQDIRTGKREVISQFPGINGAPAFSPDGNTLALVLTKTGNPKIYTLNLASGKLSQITKGYAIDTEPAWAPDGQSLLFTSNRGGTPQIYRYYLKNGQIQRITFDGNYNARGSFSPGEQHIVMMHRETGLFGIATQNLNSGRLFELTQSGYDESPSLAPNGKMVLYATKYGGRNVLAMVSTDGRIKLRLPAREGNVQEPAWSPFMDS